MTGGPGDFALSMDEIRVVVSFNVEAAQRVLPLFEQCCPYDPRPRDAVAAAWAFARGEGRTKRQRVTAVDAHRAAKVAEQGAAGHAAYAAGDAAAAAYLHPLAQATQVGHILRGAAHAARATELAAGGEEAVGDRHVALLARGATPGLVEVLERYPAAPSGKSRVAQLMTDLDAALRSSSRGT